MPPVTSCPDAAMLQKFLHGEEPAEAVESFADHLSGCPTCAASVEEAIAGDTLVDAVRSRSTVDASPKPPPALLELLLRMGRAPAAGSTSVEVTATIDQSAPAGGTDAAQALLAPPQAPGELGRLGSYRVLKQLGAGGMGIVFLAEDMHLRRKVALKVMRMEVAVSPTAKNRFLREAQAAAAVEHENIVTIHHVGEDRGVPFLAMQRLQGMSLDDFLKRQGSLPMAEAARIGRQIALGLAAAHHHGLIHRDIKPGNIWLETRPGSESGDSRVKILDFGLARALADNAGITQSGSLVGTPAYMAPEQGRGERVDHRCDLFSLGVILYRMTTGRPPFRGNSTMDILTSLALDTPASPETLNPDCPPELSRLIGQLLEKDPTKRPASADEVADRLLPLTTWAETASAQPIAEDVTSAGRPGTKAEEPSATEAITLALQPTRKKPTFGLPWVLGGILGFIAMTVCGVILVIRNKDGSETKIELPEGASVTIHEKNDRPAALVVPGDKPPPPAPVVDLDRKAAEWVIAQGGWVRVSPGGDLQNVADLPKGPFKLQGVYLYNRPVTDAELSNLKGLSLGELRLNTSLITDEGVKRLTELKVLRMVLVGGSHVTDEGLKHLEKVNGMTHLSIDQTRVTDAGLASLKNCKNLLHLDLNSTKISDAGLVHLKELKQLTGLDIQATQVTDAGLANLKEHKKLNILKLGYTQVTDAGLANLKDLRNLETLGLQGTSITGAGLVHLKDCNKLEGVDLSESAITDAGLVSLKELLSLSQLLLNGTKVTDEGLVSLKDCKELWWLSLHDTRLTDAGMVHFKAFKKLSRLNVSLTGMTDTGLASLSECKSLKDVAFIKTRVTAKGVAGFHAALPGCRIEYDGGIIEPMAAPAADPDRKAAVYVLSIGGMVHVNGDGRDIRDVADLPKEAFRLTLVNLSQNRAVTDAGLACFKDCRNLTNLSVDRSGVTDAGLAHFKDCRNLTNLDVSTTATTDAGLAHFKDQKDLIYLNVNLTQVTDAGLAYFKDCRNLTALHIGAVHVTDAGLAYFKDFTNLKALHIDHSKVTNSGLALFKDFRNLTHLYVDDTGVTDAGLTTPAGLPNLVMLGLRNTRISKHGYEQLKASIPNVGILWSEPNRLAAEQVLSLGGTIEIAESGKEPRPLKKGEPLPDRFFQLHRFTLKDCKKSLEALHTALAQLRIAETDRLESIDLTGTPVEIFPHHTPSCLNIIHGLRDLTLSNMGLTDVYLAKLPKVRRLILDGNPIRGQGLATLAEWESLNELSLNGTQITDLTATNLAGLKGLKRLSIADTGLTDVGLKYLEGLTTLEYLNLSRTKVSPSGIAALKKALPKCEVVTTAE